VETSTFPFGAYEFRENTISNVVVEIRARDISNKRATTIEYSVLFFSNSKKKSLKTKKYDFGSAYFPAGGNASGAKNVFKDAWIKFRFDRSRRRAARDKSSHISTHVYDNISVNIYARVHTLCDVYTRGGEPSFFTGCCFLFEKYSVNRRDNAGRLIPLAHPIKITPFARRSIF